MNDLCPKHATRRLLLMCRWVYQAKHIHALIGPKRHPMPKFCTSLWHFSTHACGLQSPKHSCAPRRHWRIEFRGLLLLIDFPDPSNTDFSTNANWSPVESGSPPMPPAIRWFHDHTTFLHFFFLLSLSSMVSRPVFLLGDRKQFKPTIAFVLTAPARKLCIFNVP